LIRRRLPSRLRFAGCRRSLRSAAWEEARSTGWWFEVVGVVVAVVVKCARMCGGCFFGALGGVGGLVVDVLALVVDVVNAVHAVAAVAAPDIVVG
jgi:hypothetical protein